MNWIKLNNLDQLHQLIKDSGDKRVLIFKHSTRCSISRTALDRLERSWKKEETGQLDAYFLDLLSYREISNRIESVLDVEHESPQLLLLDKGKVVYHRSHLEIDYQQLSSFLKN